MKKILIICAAALCMAGCSKTSGTFPDGGPSGETPGIINLTLPELAATKAAATDDEKKLNSLYIAVFNSEGKLEISHECTGAEISDIGTTGVTLNVRTGTKDVWAVANVAASKFASVSDIASFKAIEVLLSDATSTSFAMEGSASGISVIADKTSQASIQLSRFAAKVSLVKVSNSLPSSYGALTVKSAYLANVVCNDNLGQTAKASSWCNRLGHNGTNLTEANVIGNGSTKAENAAVTFCTIGSQVTNAGSASLTGKSVYGFRNASTADPVARGNGFPANGCRSVLYVIATIGGVDYWYPVGLGELKSNNSYNVSLTITMPGQRPGDDDFGSLITKGALSATVVVKDWTDGSEYSETI
ncbi:MAG: fimbrial protein [Bacteroidales bacterium]|nr:fimbrial protein [Bacteroidales bacterium]